MAGDARRPGPNRKGTKVGTGGHGRKSLEGKGPTPKAEDRVYHAAHKRKQAAERREARESRPNAPRVRKPAGDELVTGRNAVLEALRARVPATTLYVAARTELDERMREAISIATRREVPVLEVMRPELDRLTGGDLLHQGIALAVRPYEYAHPLDLLDRAERLGTPLLVALDGVTDPRNLGAIIRSVAAFGGHGVLLPQRRSAGVTATAWRTSAGAAARVPVSQVVNLTRAIKACQAAGFVAVGLDADGDTDLYDLEAAVGPLLVVVGSEGRGLSRLIGETCDLRVSIPMASTVESLNASVAAAVTLAEVARRRTYA